MKLLKAEDFEACEKAKSYNFITQLLQSLDGLASEHSRMLLAVRSNLFPLTVLLFASSNFLDEATSAFSSDSEQSNGKAQTIIALKLPENSIEDGCSYSCTIK
jgi:hypothetical protein